jgi:hypothetical protein
MRVEPASFCADQGIVGGTVKSTAPSTKFLETRLTSFTAKDSEDGFVPMYFLDGERVSPSQSQDSLKHIHSNQMKPLFC